MAALTLERIFDTASAGTLIVAALFRPHSAGWTSLMVIVCLSNAALMISVGILGEYVGRIYEEGKARPLYLVADTWNLPPQVTNGEVEEFRSIGAAKNPISPPRYESEVWTSAVRSDSPGGSATKK
jgi:hypothetical protein